MSELCKKIFPHEDPVNLNKFFGDPRGSNGQVSRKWYAENIVKWTPPYPLFYSDGKKTPLRTLLLHKKVIAVYTSAFEEVKANFTPAEIKENHLDICAGTFNYRPMRGGSRLSVHSWGIAIDIDPARNPFPSTWREGMLNHEFADILEKHGLWWRGRPGDRDPMHFQCAWRK
jgi:hypothetical protein